MTSIPYWRVVVDDNGLQIKRVRHGSEMTDVYMVFRGSWQTVELSQGKMGQPPYTLALDPNTQVRNAIEKLLSTRSGGSRNSLYMAALHDFRMTTWKNKLMAIANHYGGIQGSRIYTLAEQIDQIALAHMTDEQARSAAYALEDMAAQANRYLATIGSQNV